MIQELTDTGKALQEALDRYYTACSGVQSYFARGNPIGSTLQALSDRIANELELVTSFETKLKLSKTAVSSCYNYHTTLVPINALPPEVLTRVFHFVHDAQDCNRRGKLIFPRCPDNLSHVCFNWRQVALRSRALWTHVDLAPCHSLHQGLLDRATAYVARSGGLPIHVHAIHMEAPGKYADHVSDEVERFLASVATRTRGLELTTDGDSDSHYSGDLTTLQLCISSCKPGTLTQLTIRNTFNRSTIFICPAGISGNFIPNSVDTVTVGDCSHEFLEDLWRPITVLRLAGIYLYWTSAAYQGLTELRLTSVAYPEIFISESHVVAILKSSPKLRIFQLNSIPDAPVPLETPVVPVRLDDLEVLDLYCRYGDYTSLDRLLRWIAPGSRSLQLSITGGRNVASCISDTAKAFFARSNVYKLRLAHGILECLEMDTLLQNAPNLKIIILESTSHAMPESIPTSAKIPAPGGTSSTAGARLDRLCIFSSRFHLDPLKWFLERNQVHKLSLWKPLVHHGFLREGQAPSEGEVDELYARCGEVERLESKPNLFEDWD